MKNFDKYIGKNISVLENKYITSKGIEISRHYIDVNDEIVKAIIADVNKIDFDYRFMLPNDVVSLELRKDRLNIYVGAGGVIEGFDVG